MAHLVSIIVPCYNAARWLEQTLESALAQTWPHVEIIFVDDGSTDDSLAVARRFEPRGVQVVMQPNRGASAARNHGLRIARGDFIQFLDADDLLAPEKIQRQIEAARLKDGDYLYCGTWTRFHRSPADADFAPQALCGDFDPIEWMLVKFLHNRMMHPAAWLVSRELADRTGPWDEALSLDDDGEYFSRMVLNSSGVRCCSPAVSFYRSNLPGSLSRSRSVKAWSSALASLEKSAALLQQCEDSDRVRRACATAFQHFIYDCYPHAPSCRARAKALVRKLGGSSLRPEMGFRTAMLARFIGWRMAFRLRAWLS